jgi:hydroxymethylglutaryl-CoA reductase
MNHAAKKFSLLEHSVTSRLPDFRKLSVEDRLELLGQMLELTPDELARFEASGGLPMEVASRLIENVVGTFSLPLGLGLNLLVNGREYLVPMAVEEPSVVAASSFAAKLVREAGGFRAEADESLMIGQVQVTGYGDPERATAALLAAREEILARANSLHPAMVQRGGGARDIEVRVLPAPEGPEGEPLLILHLIIDCQEAMGANLINTMAEGVAPLVEQLTGGRVFLRILSNLADQRLARASCRIPVDQLAYGGRTGESVAEGIVQASRFAQADPYRAATHNKGIMNGIDPVAIATGQDWRAIEAGAHAFACRSGQYRPLSTWSLEEGHLVGRIELPLALGLVGGPIKVHPGVQVALKLLRVGSVREFAQVLASVGLAQNLAALRALGSDGIQKGHLSMHARSVAMAAGARGKQVDEVAGMLARTGVVKVEQARELMRVLNGTPEK